MLATVAGLTTANQGLNLASQQSSLSASTPQMSDHPKESSRGQLGPLFPLLQLQQWPYLVKIEQKMAGSQRDCPFCLAFPLGCTVKTYREQVNQWTLATRSPSLQCACQLIKLESSMTLRSRPLNLPTSQNTPIQVILKVSPFWLWKTRKINTLNPNTTRAQHT